MSRITELNEIIDEAISVIAKRVKARNNKMKEPDYTAALAVELPALLKSKHFFPGVKVGGCFIHQRPKVTFSYSVDKTSCTRELGDLLVLIKKNVDGRDRFNAALIQIKKSDKKRLCISRTEELQQLELYTMWPKFTSKISRLQYDVQPKTVNMGAQYVNICNESLYVHIPQKDMNFASDFTFGRFLWDMMVWQDGRTISIEEEKNNEEWSRLIWDLIHNTLNQKFTEKNAGYPKRERPRTSGEFFDFICDTTHKICLDENSLEDENGMGISMLYIDVTDMRNDDNEQ